MPKISEMMASKYLRQEDVGDGLKLKIEDVVHANVARDDAPVELKWVLKFEGQDKGLVLNSTNLQLLGQILGDDTDLWIGKSVVLYTDPSVSYQGKLVGGIRVRAVRTASKPAPAKSAADDDMSDDVPFN